ncbi:DUF6053 domain-containing protein [Lysobacter enzymogenes]|uniref:DUF6053 domain-containing protein n=1 Tax=Lysobacter enzymogenes TaxID=69 RepID=UPI003D189655
MSARGRAPSAASIADEPGLRPARCVWRRGFGSEAVGVARLRADPNAFVGGASAPTLCVRIALTGPKSVGAEAPPSRSGPSRKRRD